MDEKDFKEVEAKALESLNVLGDSNATFMFIGSDAHCFAINGNTSLIKAELMFAMLKYPILKEIFEDCLEQYKMADSLYGDNIRKSVIKDSIEHYNGYPKSKGDA